MAHLHHHHHQAYGYGDIPSGSGHSSGMLELQAGMEMLGTSSWQQHPSRAFVDDPSSLRFDAAEHPNINLQGLSLSLPHRDQTSVLADARFHQAYQLKSSMYLIPAQELLNEFCNLGTVNSSPRQRLRDPSSSSTSTSPSWTQSALLSMDLLELQKHKARLLSMLEEVDRRYKRYCEQMRAVVSSFEAVAGRGSARVYSALASKTISRHFRCVRDGIVGQIQATKKAMGEKDPAALGATKGETPRLRLLDQCVRQQKAFQQGGGPMEIHPWRPQRGLPERSVSILRAWLFEHFLHPYPSDVDKHILARQTGLSRSQVSNWFINARVRLWKPMVEEMYLEETKEQDSSQSSQGTTAAAKCESNDNNSRADNPQLTNRYPNPSPASHLLADQKPQLTSPHLHIDSDSLASIINSNGPRAENFGVVDLDFASYNNQCGGSGGGGSSSRNFSSGVSLTLGLQQHTSGAMSLSFSPTAHQPSLFYSREQMEDCQPAPFSILDGDQGQNLPYRDLMGAQLLHDFGRLN